jgi:hypothetical protein
MIKQRYRQAGVVGHRKTAHSLRHSAITNAIRHGGTPTQVQEFAGHGSYDTTLQYYHAESRIATPAEDLISYVGQVTGGACVPTSPCRTGFAPQEGACEFSCEVRSIDLWPGITRKTRDPGRARGDNPIRER